MKWILAFVFFHRLQQTCVEKLMIVFVLTESFNYWKSCKVEKRNEILMRICYAALIIEKNALNRIILDSTVRSLYIGQWKTLQRCSPGTWCVFMKKTKTRNVARPAILVKHYFMQILRNKRPNKTCSCSKNFITHCKTFFHPQLYLNLCIQTQANYPRFNHSSLK